MKRWRFLAIVLSVVFVLSSCGKKNDSADDSALTESSTPAITNSGNKNISGDTAVDDKNEELADTDKINAAGTGNSDKIINDDIIDAINNINNYIENAEDNDNVSVNKEQNDEINNNESNEESDEESENKKDASENEKQKTVMVSLDEISSTITGNEADEMIGLFKNLSFSDNKETIILTGSVDWDAYILNAESRGRYTRINTSEGWKIFEYYSKKIYDDSDKITDIVLKNLSAENSENRISGSTNNSAIIGYSIEHSEPVSEEEYLDAGISLLSAWLTEAKSEDTEDYYRNTGFSIDDSGKSGYLSCGLVNGKKEFAVELCFNASDTGDDTFYDRYFQEGRYTEGGKYWSGNYICARIRWEQGMCTLLKIGTRDDSYNVQKGLDGIVKGEYKNFFEFARRPDMDEAIEECYVPYSPAHDIISRSLTQTADGVPVEFCIYPSGSYKEEDGYITSIFDFCTTMNGEAAYSTGVYFTDYGTGHMEDTLPKNFRLTFDNYDGDANPDYCIRYMNDEDGTYYVLERLISDGRVLNLSGRAFEGGIYIAGCFEPSPRLQRTENISYIGWKIEDGKYYPTDSNGNRTELPELNMYSDRLYLPMGINAYSEDENTVTCFLWNNTENIIKTDSQYSIEVLEGKQWKEVAKGLKTEHQNVNPRSYAEISYDISSIKDRLHAKYRVVQKCGDLTAYGEFICEGEEITTFTADTSSITSGMHCTTITINNTEFSKINLESAVLITEGKEIPLSILEKRSEYYKVFSGDMPEKPGEYDILLNDTVYTKLLIEESSVNYNINVNAVKEPENVIVSILSDTELKLKNISCYKKQDDSYEEIYLMMDTEDKEYAAANEKIVHKSELYTIKLIDFIKEFYNDEFLEETYRQLQEYDMDEIYYEGITKDMSYEDFKKKVADLLFYNPESEYYSMIYLTDNNDNDVVVFHRF